MQKRQASRLFILMAALCLLLSGCGNAFAHTAYNSDEKIAQEGDHYSKQSSVLNPIDGGVSLTVDKFDGYQTIWQDTLDTAQDIEAAISFSLSNGQAKIVHIDADGTVTTILECTPDTCTDGFVTQTVSFSSGENRIKTVGYDCEDMTLLLTLANDEI